ELRRSGGIEPTVQHDRGVLEATQLQEHLPSRDLGDVQEPRKPSPERLGDYPVNCLEGVFFAIDGNECARPPQPGQELIESVCIRELVADDRLEQLEGAHEVTGQ